jgi:hypothetical protein
MGKIMTDFKALADAAVRQGVGKAMTMSEAQPFFDTNEMYYSDVPDFLPGEFYIAEDFIKDGRTALALMEKVDAIECAKTSSNKWTVLTAAPDEPFDVVRHLVAGFRSRKTDLECFVALGEPLPVAIVTACLRALGEDL